MLACDAVGFVLWMMVLRDMKVSAAIPMSAASYILIIAAGWIGFHEPVTLAQLLGGGLVLAGVTMLRREA
jgi:drug/metabolite transporter (DMT)-like permease